MTTSNTICLPAHILDADISPRVREVLMLLASQTSAAQPSLWICQKTIAARLRCCVATVARAMQKLLEAKLIAETGKLHEGRYKFYHIRWSSDENLKAVSKKITQPVRKVVAKQIPPAPFASPVGYFKGGERAPRPVEEEMSPPPQSTLSPPAFRKDDRIAYYAEIARKQIEENRRRYRAELLSMR